MRRSRLLAAVIVCCVIASTGCSALLEGGTYVMTTHIAPPLATPSNEVVTATDYNGIVSAVNELILARKEHGEIEIYEYYVDEVSDLTTKLSDDLVQIRDYFATQSAIGCYALDDIDISLVQIVTYYKITVDLSFRRSKAQINSIVTVSTSRYLSSVLLDRLSEVTEENIIQTSISSITAESIQAEIERLYYDNPLLVVMIPIVAITQYPPPDENGVSPSTRIFEIAFEYEQASAILKNCLVVLRGTTGELARRATGSSDAEIIQSLVTTLCDVVSIDEVFSSLATYSRQKYAATAYGALQGTPANSEGYAMAFKALCDELSVTCVVVTGSRFEKRHVWNIVTIEGKSYHIDTLQCDDDGFDLFFMKSDADFAAEGYVWEVTAYPACPNSYIP